MSRGRSRAGVAQGIGWALNEEYIYDRNGRLDNAGFLDYRVPVASDMPMIEPILVEVPNPAHPFGAKGVGEVNIVRRWRRSPTRSTARSTAA
jgi:CO/xanthine dehydrogenase Mo-binding subunit